MISKCIIAILVLLVTVAVTANAGKTEDAAKCFADGSQCLAKADFDGALKAYADAVKGDPENQDYKAEYQVLTRVQNMHKNLSAEKDEKRWESMLRALHSYYCTHKLYEQAKELDKQLYERQKSEAAAVMLAETQLELNENKATERLLKSHMEGEATDYCRMLYGISLARQNKRDEAKSILTQKPITVDAPLGVRFQSARLYALLGEEQEVMTRLKSVFESVPPSRLGKIKEYVQETADFQSYSGSGQVATVLKTESKVPESKCSGGASCGSCPSATSCGKK